MAACSTPASKLPGVIRGRSSGTANEPGFVRPRPSPSTTARRSEQILQELLRNGEVAVDKLAEQLEVSEATIRRDLTELERQGLLLRSHGGAVPVAPMLYEPFRHLSSFQEQEEKCAAEKRRIGLLAASLITDGEIIAQICQRLGVGVIRGSTARGGCHALLEMIRNQDETTHLAITPDGPRGPRRELKAGVVMVASQSGLPIVPVGIGVSGPTASTFALIWKLEPKGVTAAPCPSCTLVGRFAYAVPDVTRSATTTAAACARSILRA